MTKKLVTKTLQFLFLFVLSIGLSYFWLNLHTYSNYKDRIYSDPSDVAQTKVALVLGAGSNILEDRVDAASELYNQGKVAKLLMSGDNRFVDHNEPSMMRLMAQNNGVSDLDIYSDYAGRRTYDSCWRARNIFGLDEVVIVTQSWHLPRAMYLCESLGMKVYGYASDPGNAGVTPGRLYSKVNWNYWKLRDSISLFQAFFEINFFPPTDVVGGEKIEIL